MYQFKKTFEFHDHVPYEKTRKEPSGAVFTTRESVITHTFTANYGDVVEVPTWVLESEHFKMVVAAGDAVEVATPVAAE